MNHQEIRMLAAKADGVVTTSKEYEQAIKKIVKKLKI